MLYTCRLTMFYTCPVLFYLPSYYVVYLSVLSYIPFYRTVYLSVLSYIPSLTVLYTCLQVILNVLECP